MQIFVLLCIEREMKLLLLILATVCMSNVKSVKGGDDEPHLVAVTRRLSHDFYYYNGFSGAFSCDNDLYINVTYLVSERLCVAEEELFRRGECLRNNAHNNQYSNCDFMHYLQKVARP